jgi:uncharacterized protein
MPALSYAKQRFEFTCDGSILVGTLRVPHGSELRPGLLFEGPLTSVKEQVTGNYADALAARGFVTLAFDHRYFGESEGEPRQYEHPGRKVEDLSAAVAALQTSGLIDAARIGLVGVCAGAGYAAWAVAKDANVRAFAAVAGFFHDIGQQRAWMGEGFDAALEGARLARLRYEQTGDLDSIPAVASSGEAAMPLREAFEYYGTARGAVPNYINRFATLSREQTLPWDAQSAAPLIAVPTLMVHSDGALAPGLARKFFAALSAPKRELWVQSQGQIDFYDRPAMIEPVADELAQHFRQCL